MSVCYFAAKTLKKSLKAIRIRDVLYETEQRMIPCMMTRQRRRIAEKITDPLQSVVKTPETKDGRDTGMWQSLIVDMRVMVAKYKECSRDSYCRWNLLSLEISKWMTSHGGHILRHESQDMIMSKERCPKRRPKKEDIFGIVDWRLRKASSSRKCVIS